MHVSTKTSHHENRYHHVHVILPHNSSRHYDLTPLPGKFTTRISRVKDSEITKIPVVLAVNKSDLKDSTVAVPNGSAQLLAAKCNCPFFEVSVHCFVIVT